MVRRRKMEKNGEGHTKGWWRRRRRRRRMVVVVVMVE